jgi:hypothetical protein
MQYVPLIALYVHRLDINKPKSFVLEIGVKVFCYDTYIAVIG